MKAALLRIPGADYRESSQSSAFQADTLFGGWPASLGDMVRFLAQAGLSCNARPWEQTLFLPSAWHPSPGPPWLLVGRTQSSVGLPTAHPSRSPRRPPTNKQILARLSEKHAARTEKL